MPVRKLNTINARKLLQSFRFADLFIEELGWLNAATSKVHRLTHEGTKWQAVEVSHLSGFRVFEVTPEVLNTPMPDAQTQMALWKQIVLQSIENIVIFTDQARTQSLWLWMKRDGKRTIARRHHFIKGQPGDLFLSRLAALTVDIAELDEHGNIPITDTAERVRSALDIEAVTKRFFKDFQEQHIAFLELIHGIKDDRQRRWYASVLLNRLMFIWFLQEKGFLDGGNRTYLRDKLAISQKQEKNKFFRQFLKDLFFEGFAKPPAKRECSSGIPLGTIPYLNGGLFLPHKLEDPTKHPKLDVPDEAFENVFALFARYSWSLDDTPGGKDDEINPDVLGYIFEKYINQKDFGAYYTRPEITEYLCEQTIHQLVLDAAHDYLGAKLSPASAAKVSATLKIDTSTRFESIADLLFRASGPLVGHLLHTVLPRMALLDPACGSGAFLVAALKTLLNLYTGLIGRAEALSHRPVLQAIEKERAKHKASLAYWVKRRIITDNLYGVDIMEEATEIAKLRLFLAMVASADTADKLEPLPNIEFNILPGNSLLGLLHVDPAAFDLSNGPRRQSALKLKTAPTHDELGMDVEISIAPTDKEKAAAYLASRHSSKYADLLREKNRRIELYKKAAADYEDLRSVRDSIEAIKSEARLVLDRLLLEQFQVQGIRFSQATWDEKKGTEGKPELRKLAISDLRTEEAKPFHWGYEFDEVLARGGFDAIITNPPWEIFKPQAKEFFDDHSEIVTKNSMRIEDFEKEKKKMLKDESIREAWLEYLSRFPHLSEWFRSAPQFANQISIVNGRKAGTDINLYKLFTEQCLNLLRPHGYCGIVIPSGIYTDLGAKQLRVMLMEQNRITGLFGFENRRAIFDGVHRSFKFIVLSCRRGGRTVSFPAAFMRLDPKELIGWPGPDALPLTPELIARLSPDTLSIMEFHSALDVEIAEKMLRYPVLGEAVPGAWKISFTAEFHMTNDSHLFHNSPGKSRMPVFEGKMIHQFQHALATPRYWVEETEGRSCVLGREQDLKQALDYQRYRLCFRDIARNTDNRTLISTVIPPGRFCGNTLISSTSPHDVSTLLAITSLFTSFTIDWLIRQKVTAHCNIFYMMQLPIPRLTVKDSAFRPLMERAARLVGTTAEFDALLKEVFGPKATHKSHGVSDPMDRQKLRAEIDALVAQLYGLTESEFAHILGTFPLVDESIKVQTRNTFRELAQFGKFA